MSKRMVDRCYDGFLVFFPPFFFFGAHQHDHPLPRPASSLSCRRMHRPFVRTTRTRFAAIVRVELAGGAGKIVESLLFGTNPTHDPPSGMCSRALVNNNEFFFFFLVWAPFSSNKQQQLRVLVQVQYQVHIAGCSFTALVVGG